MGQTKEMYIDTQSATSCANCEFYKRMIDEEANALYEKYLRSLLSCYQCGKQYDPKKTRSGPYFCSTECEQTFYTELE